MALDKLSGNSFATGAIANSLGYTPANKAGDTFTGAVSFSNTANVTGHFTGTTGQFSSYLVTGSTVSADPGSNYYSFTHRMGGSLAVANNITIGNTSPSMALSVSGNAHISANIFSNVTRYSDLGPSLIIDCANGKHLHDYVKCMRYSNDSYVLPSGVVKKVGWREPKFRFDTTTGECLGLYCDPVVYQKAYNTEFQQGTTSYSYGSWDSANYSYGTTNQYLPTGEYGPCMYVTRGAGGPGAADWGQYSAVWVANKYFTISFWVKGSGTIAGSSHSNFDNVSTPTLTLDPNKWQRYVMTRYCTAATGGYMFLAFSGISASTTAYVWGFQIEQSDTNVGVTNYIPNIWGSSIITRDYDYYQMSYNKLRQYAGPQTGTWVAEFSTANTSSFNVSMGTDTTNYTSLNYSPSGGSMGYFQPTNGGLGTLATAYSVGEDVFNTYGLSYSGTTNPVVNISVNGSSNTTTGSGTSVMTLQNSSLWIGRSHYYNQLAPKTTLRRMKLFKNAANTTQLSALTTNN